MVGGINLKGDEEQIGGLKSDFEDSDQAARESNREKPNLVSTKTAVSGLSSGLGKGSPKGRQGRNRRV